MTNENKPLNERENRHCNGITKYFESEDVKQAVKEAYEELIIVSSYDIIDKNTIKKIFKNKFGFDLE